MLQRLTRIFAGYVIACAVFILFAPLFLDVEASVSSVSLALFLLMCAFAYIFLSKRISTMKSKFFKGNEESAQLHDVLPSEQQSAKDGSAIK